MKTRKFDIAEMLETEADIRGFLVEAAEGTPEEFIHALNTAARAMGMTEVAKKAGVTRASLYKSLAENGNPNFKTISKVTEALGCKLKVA
ncbi:MAG: putative addiction module antidote protein [Desulfuromusa sp.]